MVKGKFVSLDLFDNFREKQEKLLELMKEELKLIEEEKYEEAKGLKERVVNLQYEVKMLKDKLFEGMN